MRPSGIGSFAQSAGQPSMKQGRSSASSASARSATRSVCSRKVLALAPDCDRRDLGEQTSDGRVGRERRPARLKRESLRGNVFGDQIAQRRCHGRALCTLTRTTAQSRATETDVTVECHEGDGAASLAAPTRPPCLATAMPLRPGCDLRINDLALNGSPQRLSLGDRQAEILPPLRVLLEYPSMAPPAAPSSVVI
jgi:hypothetical protein